MDWRALNEERKLFSELSNEKGGGSRQKHTDFFLLLFIKNTVPPPNTDINTRSKEELIKTTTTEPGHSGPYLTPVRLPNWGITGNVSLDVTSHTSKKGDLDLSGPSTHPPGQSDTLSLLHHQTVPFQRPSWNNGVVEIIWNVSAFCPSYLLKMNINRNVLKTQLLARTETEKVIRHMPYNSLLKCKIGCLCATITTLHFGILVPPQRWMNTVLLNCHSPNFPSPSIPDSH